MPHKSVNFKLSSVVSIIPLVLLGACGSTSGSDPAFPTAQAALNEVEDFITRIDPLSDTPDSQLPSGVVAYDGLMLIASDVTNFDIPSERAADRLFAVGEMTITADFDSTDITGVASNFVDGNDNQVGGQLELAATLGSNGFPQEFGGTVSGDLLLADGSTNQFDLDVGGGFLGADGQVIVGDGEGTFDFKDGTPVVPFSINFGGEQ